MTFDDTQLTCMARQILLDGQVLVNFRIATGAEDEEQDELLPPPSTQASTCLIN